MSKRCKKCLECKPASEFYLNPGKGDGLWPRCKPCDRARSREYYRKNKEHITAIRRERQRSLHVTVDRDTALTLRELACRRGVHVGTVVRELLDELVRLEKGRLNERERTGTRTSRSTG